MSKERENGRGRFFLSLSCMHVIKDKRPAFVCVITHWMLPPFSLTYKFLSRPRSRGTTFSKSFFSLFFFLLSRPHIIYKGKRNIGLDSSKKKIKRKGDCGHFPFIIQDQPNSCRFAVESFESWIWMKMMQSLRRRTRRKEMRAISKFLGYEFVS